MRYRVYAGLNMKRSSAAIFQTAIFIGYILFISACAPKNDKADTYLKDQFAIAENLSYSNKPDSAFKILSHIRASIKPSNPLICDYYCFFASANFNDPVKTDLYADSAMAYFTDESRITEYPKAYFNSLLAKGDACLKKQKYLLALNYYFKAKKVLSSMSCDNGILASKMGVIYFKQNNFVQAAKYWVESASRLNLCDKQNAPTALFYEEQGALNSAGFSFDKAGMIDSALIYYKKGMALIDQTEREKIVSQQKISASRAVLFDNLGGIRLKQGDLTGAEEYLIKSLSIPNDDDGSHIPPLIKLAEVYIKTDRMPQALDAIKKCRLLLDRYYKDNSESDIKWNKLYSEYLFRQNDTKKAFLYQSNYIRLRDSMDHKSSELYRLDVERELNTLQQQNELNELAQKDKMKMTYLAGIGVIALLSVVIILLINRSLKRIQKNHREATLQNKQLQSTLAELELANKNYIRIMRVMAHDLRNPISGMTGLAALMLDDEHLTEENKHMLRLIETTGTHSMEMISELLRSGLADENEPVIKQPLDLKALLYDSVELLRFKANEKGQQLIFESDNEPIMANVNHEKIWRVFNNIIVNAIKFSHQDGMIRVQITRDQHNILITVADSGVGIPDADKPNIFEMFTSAKKIGTGGEQPFGLGLSISKKIIEKHGGKIWFESTAGVGTTFYIQLPAAT